MTSAVGSVSINIIVKSYDVVIKVYTLKISESKSESK